MVYRKVKAGTVVTLRWNDPAMLGGWVKEPETVTPAECITRAFIAGATKTSLLISHTRADDGTWMGVAAIPWGTIRSMTKEKKR